MSELTVTVVIPVFNEDRWIVDTLRALATAVVRAPSLRVDVVVVDDGSTDGTADAAVSAQAAVPVRVIRQANAGRFAARVRGIESATGTLVLLLDSRISLDADALAFVAARLEDDPADTVWNGHVVVETEGNPYGSFWNALTEIAWADYFDDPRTTHFGAAEFDRFPKGAGCFLAPRSLLIESFGASASYYDDSRITNDDTPVIRWIAERHPIGISPSFSCRYRPRDALRPFVRHAFHRGAVFLDGHGRRGSRFLPVVVAFYPASAAFALLALRRPFLAAAVAGGVGAVAGGVGAARRRPVRRDDRSRGSRSGVRSRTRPRHVEGSRPCAAGPSSTRWAGVIVVVFGTTGELIKLLPVLVRLQERGDAFQLVSTGQQVNQIPRLLELGNLPTVDVWLARGHRGRDLRTSSDIPGWAATVARTFASRRRALRRTLRGGPGRPLVLVHGDTMTTLYGAVLGRLLRVPVAHIESGLRSFDLRHPFPEELNRRLTSRIATYLYAPGSWAAGNLSRGTVVDTGSNTVRDALAIASAAGTPGIELPDEAFGIASLHRFELLNHRDLLARTIDVLNASGRRFLWVDHPVTIAALAKHGLTDRLGRQITPIPRLDFFSFVPVMRRASFLVTDSGGSQEETYYLDIPCLVHRKRTERQEGLGQNVVLSGYDDAVLRDFLTEPASHRRTDVLPESSPADVIVDDLELRGFAA